jgi:hypothetical protein
MLSSDRARRQGPAFALGWVGALRTAAMGAALAGLNPKNLALTAAASASIGRAGLGGSETAIAIAVFVAIGSGTVLGPVLIQLLAPQRAAGAFEPIRRFMALHNDAIMMTVLSVLGHEAGRERARWALNSSVAGPDGA